MKRQTSLDPSRFRQAQERQGLCTTSSRSVSTVSRDSESKPRMRKYSSSGALQKRKTGLNLVQSAGEIAASGIAGECPGRDWVSSELEGQLSSATIDASDVIVSSANLPTTNSESLPTASADSITADAEADECDGPVDLTYSSNADTSPLAPIAEMAGEVQAQASHDHIAAVVLRTP